MKTTEAPPKNSEESVVLDAVMADGPGGFDRSVSVVLRSVLRSLLSRRRYRKDVC